MAMVTARTGDQHHLVCMAMVTSRTGDQHHLVCMAMVTARTGDQHHLVCRAVTSAATFSVAPGLAPLLFKIDSGATGAASILTVFKRCANR